MTNKLYSTKDSPFSESEQSEIIKDLKKLGMSPAQIQECLKPTEPREDLQDKYNNVFFEDIVIFYDAQRKVEWPDVGYCGHRHTSEGAARRCAEKRGSEWYIAKNVACGFEGQLLHDLLITQEKILLMKGLPLEKRSESLSDGQLDQLSKDNAKNIKLAKSICPTQSIPIPANKKVLK